MRELLDDMKLFLILALLSSSALANPVFNENSGYSSSPDCYGQGCLPSALLQKVIESPTYYTQERLDAEERLELMKKANQISEDQLEVEKQMLNEIESQQ